MKKVATIIALVVALGIGVLGSALAGLDFGSTRRTSSSRSRSPCSGSAHRSMRRPRTRSARRPPMPNRPRW